MQDVFSNFDLVLRAFWLTIQLAVVSGIASVVLGTLLAAARVGPVPVLAKAAAVYVTVLRNTPLLIIFVFAAFGLPKLEVRLPFFVMACTALSVYTAAFVCEAIRSGVNAVPLGQAEAARAIGMGFGQTMGNVILPQALRAVVPPLVSVLIALTKNTSVAAAFGLIEATARMKYFTNRNADDRVLIFVTFAVGYIIIVELLSLGAGRLEQRWKVASR